MSDTDAPTVTPSTEPAPEGFVKGRWYWLSAHDDLFSAPCIEVSPDGQRGRFPPNPFGGHPIKAILGVNDHPSETWIKAFGAYLS